MTLQSILSRALLLPVILAGVCAFTPGLKAAATSTAPTSVADRKEGEFVPVLKTKTVTYTNVTLRAISDTDLFISYSGGVLNIKLSEFRPESLAAIESVRAKLPRMAGKSEPKEERKKFTLPGLPANWAMDFKLGDQQIHLSSLIVAGVVTGLALGWLFFCLCCRLICLKAAVNPGILIWLPVLQIFPMLKAAQMPTWWFFVFLVPVVNLVAQILWCVNIVRVREKGWWLTILLILPVTSFLAFLYLAFSSGLTVKDRHKLDVANRYAV